MLPDGRRGAGLRRRLSPLAVYTMLSCTSSFLLTVVFTVETLYHLMVVHMNPLQLVLTGTILEATIFLFEVPTGVLADARSRRLSIVIGYVLIGLGFILEASVPLFWSVALAQVIWGLGYTFTSGATEAWIVDEIGQARAGEAFLRGAQASRAGTLVAIPISAAIGSIRLALPMVLGGACMVLLACFLAVTMSEEGYQPAHGASRHPFRIASSTMRAARGLLGRQPLLLGLLGIGLFFGLYSEGFDRLWQAHLLQSFNTAWLASVPTVVWMAGIDMIGTLLSMAAISIVQHRVDVARIATLGRILVVTTGAIVLALAGFGLARRFDLALALLWLIVVLRAIHGPLHATWFNQRIDNPQVRATLFSISSQVDSIGQVAGGPGVGAIGNASIRLALVASAAILSPA
ncbi:MAG: MFS transporter, partial [Anaerolineales bacterium]|nr:MFS transporter [Anaerolineales bacterium]